MSDPSDVPDVTDDAFAGPFVDPYDSGVFNEAAAAKHPEWERLLADSISEPNTFDEDLGQL